MNEVDLILEKCSIDIWDGMYEPIWEDGTQFLEDVITEAGHGASKKNIFRKLWNAIVKIWKWICKQWNKLLSWIKRVFSRKKTKTADQILKEVLPGVGAAAVAAGGIGIAIADQSPSSVRSVTKANDPISVVEVEIPKSEKSEMSIEDKIQLMVKPIEVKFNTDRGSVSIKCKDAINYSPWARNHGNVPGQNVVAAVDHRWWVDIIVLIEHPVLMWKLRESFKHVHHQPDGRIIIDDEFANLQRQYMSDLEKLRNSYKDNVEDEISLDKLSKISKELNNFMDLIESFGTIDEQAFEASQVVLHVMNNFMLYCAKFQMNINAFTRVIQNAYVIDAKFMQSITDLSVMDQFIKSMIDATIPPKFIAYNSFLAASPKLIEGRKDGYKPIWGQSRLVIHSPDGRYVYKFALSKWGRNANSTEWNISQEFQKHTGGSEFIAITHKIEQNHMVVSTEAIDTEHRINSDETWPLVDRLEEFCQRHKLAIISDLHPGNFGRRLSNKKPVITDYGAVFRRDVGVYSQI